MSLSGAPPTYGLSNSLINVTCGTTVSPSVNTRIEISRVLPQIPRPLPHSIGSEVGVQADPQFADLSIEQIVQQPHRPQPSLQISPVSGAGAYLRGEEERRLSALMIYLTSLDENLDPQPLPLNNVNTVTNHSPVMAPADQYFLMIGERCWHSDCLRCCLCGRTLHSAASCFYKDGLVFCREDYTSKFSKRCERCTSMLSYDDVVMRARDAVFHLRCFTCCVCAAPLHPGELFAMGEHGTLYCHGHYEPVSSTQAECSLMRSEPAEIRFGRGKTRCRKGKKTSEDGENGSDNIDFCDEEVLTQSSRSKRMRTSFKHHQLRTMKSYFNLNHNPDAKDLKQLAQRTGLTKRVLQVWFQNARAKFRRSTMQGREGGSLSPQISRIGSVPSNEQTVGSGSASLGGGSARTSLSPEESSQRENSLYEQSTSPVDHIGETVLSKVDDLQKAASPAKTLAEYFESDPTLL